MPPAERCPQQSFQSSTASPAPAAHSPNLRLFRKMSIDKLRFYRIFFSETLRLTPRDSMTPAEYIIERFDGTTALARALGLAPSTVHSWKSTGQIPAKWVTPILNAGQERGLRLKHQDFFEAPKDSQQ